MTQLAATPDTLTHLRDQLASALAPHQRALVLGCMAIASVLVYMIPAAAETRCMLARQAALSAQSALSLSMALTTLGWYFHKPVLARIGALRDKFASRT